LRFIAVVGSASKHKHGHVCESTTDEPITDKAPTMLLSQAKAKAQSKHLYNDMICLTVFVYRRNSGKKEILTEESTRIWKWVSQENGDEQF
jgi:hypothetical protein